MIETGSRLGRTPRAVAVVAVVAGLVVPALAEAKTPGKTYCFLGVCHRVKTLAETERQIGRTTELIASHYDHCQRDRYNPCGLTASGEVFRPDHPDNAASPIYPNGTRLLVWNPANKRTAVVRINNAGPYWGKRTLDLSRAAAAKLGFERQGVAKLHVKVLTAPSKAEAAYVRNRTYEPVPGPIGLFETIDTALLVVAQAKTAWFPSPVHAVAGRPNAAEAAALAAAERRRVEVQVAARPSRLARLERRSGWLASRAGNSGPWRSARLAQEEGVVKAGESRPPITDADGETARAQRVALEGSPVGPAWPLGYPALPLDLR